MRGGLPTRAWMGRAQRLMFRLLMGRLTGDPHFGLSPFE